MERTGNPHLRTIEDRAIKALVQRKKNEPTSKKAKNIKLAFTAWGTGLGLEINAQMVYDVRADLVRNYGGCSVCYATVGDDDWRGHVSGANCPTIPLDENENADWRCFKNNLELPGGIMCFRCLLPTVRSVF